MKALWQCMKTMPEEMIESYVNWPESLADCEHPGIAFAAGNGMTDFNIHDSDVLFFDMERSPMPGDIAVVSPSKDEPPLIRQMLVDLNRGQFCLHASGLEKRENIYCTDPVIYGTVTSVQSKIRKPAAATSAVKSA